MVSRGPTPAHRKGTSGRPWVRFRKGLLRGATNCCYCYTPFVTDAACEHRSHQGLRGCPTHPQYPTVEHPQALIQGGAPRSRDNAMVACSRCNSSRGAGVRPRRHTPLEW